MGEFCKHKGCNNPCAFERKECISCKNHRRTKAAHLAKEELVSVQKERDELKIENVELKTEIRVLNDRILSMESSNTIALTQTLANMSIHKCARCGKKKKREGPGRPLKDPCTC